MDVYLVLVAKPRITRTSVVFTVSFFPNLLRKQSAVCTHTGLMRREVPACEGRASSRRSTRVAGGPREGGGLRAGVATWLSADGVRASHTGHTERACVCVSLSVCPSMQETEGEFCAHLDHCPWAWDTTSGQSVPHFRQCCECISRRKSWK